MSLVGVDIGQKNDPTTIVVAECRYHEIRVTARTAGYSRGEGLAQELLDYEIRIDEDANDRYGAFKVGTKDDLVTALGLAVQIDPKGGPITTKGLAKQLRQCSYERLRFL